MEVPLHLKKHMDALIVEITSSDEIVTLPKNGVDPLPKSASLYPKSLRIFYFLIIK